MKLYEFFSKPVEVGKKGQNLDVDKLSDDLFWYIIDHDKLHKDYFFPIANKLKKTEDCEPEEILKMFMPMVVKGCKEYYQDKELKGKLGKEFPKELRDGMCHRLYDHYNEDIKKDKYKLG